MKTTVEELAEGIAALDQKLEEHKLKEAELLAQRSRLQQELWGRKFACSIGETVTFNGVVYVIDGFTQFCPVGRRILVKTGELGSKRENLYYYPGIRRVAESKE